MSGLAEILDENTRLRKEMVALRGSLSTTQSELSTTQSELSSAHHELKVKAAMVEELKQHADALSQELWLVRQGHQGPASQRYVPIEQQHLPLFADGPLPPQAPVEQPPSDEEETESSKKRSSKKGGTPRRRNRDDFAHLPAKAVHCAAEDTPCPSCGDALVVIGTAESTRIEYVPGHFLRLDITRDKCSCPRCPEQGVLTAPGPFALDRSLAANGLVARVIVDKFADHIPANRQAKRMAREGFEVGSQTLSSWLCKPAVSSPSWPMPFATTS